MIIRKRGLLGRIAMRLPMCIGRIYSVRIGKNVTDYIRVTLCK